MYEPNLRLLTESEIWGNEQHAYLKEKDTYCDTTDLTVALGGLQSRLFEEDGIRSCGWYSASSSGFGGVYCVDEGGDHDCYDDYLNYRSLAARPASPMFSAISQSPRTGVRGAGWYEVEYGEYPQDIATASISEQLERIFTSRKTELKTTGKSYEFDSVRWDDYATAYTPKQYREYEFGGKKYIRLECFAFMNDRTSYAFSDGKPRENGDVIWLEVSPVKWAIDERTGIAITTRSAFAGIQFMDKVNAIIAGYKGDFAKTRMAEFCKNYSKQLVPEMERTQEISSVDMKLPDCTPFIGEYGLYGVKLSSLEIPMSVRHIHEKAFLDNPNLQFITFHQGKEMKRISLKNNPIVLINKVLQTGNIENFETIAPFVKQMKEQMDIIAAKPLEEQQDFYKFANALGCFIKGKEQQGVSMLQMFLKNGGQNIEFHDLFSELPDDFNNVDERFIKFLKIKEGKNFPNLEFLLSQSHKNKTAFATVMTDWDAIEKSRTVVEKGTGRHIELSHKKAIEKYLVGAKFKYVTDENRDIAEALLTFGQVGSGGQAILNMATKLRTQAANLCIDSHILGMALAENSLEEEIEAIKNQTSRTLEEAEKALKTIANRVVTYEWLDKHDPHNAFMGIIVGCCATITGSHWGAKVAEATITAPDVQNLVVRDIKGDIIGKGAMYVNFKEGYAVINEFDAKPDLRSGTMRKQIWDAFMRGVSDFIEQYNKTHKKPIKVVTAGLGYNKFIEETEHLPAHTILKVPGEYGFSDAKEGQHIIWPKQDELDRPML